MKRKNSGGKIFGIPKMGIKDYFDKRSQKQRTADENRKKSKKIFIDAYDNGGIPTLAIRAKNYDSKFDMSLDDLCKQVITILNNELSK